MRKNTCFFLIAVIIIITLIFSTMSYFDRTLKKDTSELIIEIDNIISENKNNQKNFEKSKKLIELWENKLPKWSFIVHHSIIEKIDAGFICFSETMKQGNTQSMVLEGEKLKSLLKIISEQDELSLSNIL